MCRVCWTREDVRGRRWEGCEAGGGSGGGVHALIDVEPLDDASAEEAEDDDEPLPPATFFCPDW